MGCSPKLGDQIRAQESNHSWNASAKPLCASCKVANIYRRTPLVKAINYTFNQWMDLQLFAADNQVAIDSRLVENTILPTPVGK